MRIRFISAPENDDCRDRVVIEVNGKDYMSFYDGEPEDNNLCRNFNDIYSIPNLITLVLLASKSGEEIIVERVTEYI